MDIAAILDSMTGAGRVLTVPWGIDYFSIIVGAITGALFACERKLDTVGTVVLGLVTAYGGGLIRDVILQDEGVYFTEHSDLIVICILLCLFVFYFRGLFKNLDRAVMLADTLSVALFALAGASKAFAAGSGIVVSIILGAITAVGGALPSIEKEKIAVTALERAEITVFAVAEGERFMSFYVLRDDAERALQLVHDALIAAKE